MNDKGRPRHVLIFFLFSIFNRICNIIYVLIVFFVIENYQYEMNIYKYIYIYLVKYKNVL